MAERTSNILTVVTRLATGIAERTDEREIVQFGVETLVEALSADHGGLAMIDVDNPDIGTVVAEYPAHGALGQKIPFKDNTLLPSGTFFSDPVIVRDVQTDPNMLEDLRATLLGLHVRSLMIMPLVAYGKLIGTFGVDYYDRPREITTPMVELGRALAGQLAVAVQTLRIAADAQQRARQVERIARNESILNRLTSQLQQSAEPQAMLQATLLELGQAIQARRGRARLLSSAQEQSLTNLS